jgi:hypothetical protein
MPPLPPSESATQTLHVTSEACLIAALAALSPLPAGAEGCATPDERAAAAVRILQINLQVAALECASVPGSTRAQDYNAFVLRNRPSLLLATHILQDHYRPNSGADPVASLDAFNNSIRALDQA